MPITNRQNFVALSSLVEGLSLKVTGIKCPQTSDDSLFADRIRFCPVQICKDASGAVGSHLKIKASPVSDTSRLAELIYNLINRQLYAGTVPKPVQIHFLQPALTSLGVAHGQELNVGLLSAGHLKVAPSIFNESDSIVSSDLPAKYSFTNCFKGVVNLN